MPSNLVRYKHYVAEIRYDESADSFHGCVIGMREVIDFYGRTPEELRGGLHNHPRLRLLQELSLTAPATVALGRDRLSAIQLRARQKRAASSGSYP